MTDDLKPSPCFPYDKLDDLILFGMMFLMLVLVAILNHWDLVNSIATYFMGAATAYIKGQRG